MAESDRFFLPTAVPKTIVTLETTDTDWTAGWKKIRSLRANSLELKCVEKGGACEDPAVGDPADNLPPKTTLATVTGLYPDTEYTCYLITETKKNQKCSKPIPIKTGYSTRAYINAPMPLTADRRLLEEGQYTQVCNLDSKGAFIECVSAQLNQYLPFALEVNVAAVGRTYKWITFLATEGMDDMNDMNSQDMNMGKNKMDTMYTCPLNPDGTAISEDCVVVFSKEDAAKDSEEEETEGMNGGGNNGNGNFMIVTAVFNDQATKVWIRTKRGQPVRGYVCDIDANGIYQNCQMLNPKGNEEANGLNGNGSGKKKGQIVPSPDGQNVYLVSEQILYCDAIIDDCNPVAINEQDTEVNVANVENGGPNNPYKIGFQSPSVAFLSKRPAAADPSDSRFLATSIWRCLIETPTELLCEPYGVPFEEPTRITGFVFANNGANVYLWIDPLKNDLEEEDISASTVVPDSTNISALSDLSLMDNGSSEMMTNFYLTYVCDVGTEALANCIQVLDYEEDQDFVAFTRPIIF